MCLQCHRDNVLDSAKNASFLSSHCNTHTHTSACTHTHTHAPLSYHWNCHLLCMLSKALWETQPYAIISAAHFPVWYQRALQSFFVCTVPCERRVTWTLYFWWNASSTKPTQFLSNSFPVKKGLGVKNPSSNDPYFTHAERKRMVPAVLSNLK